MTTPSDLEPSVTLNDHQIASLSAMIDRIRARCGSNADALALAGVADELRAEVLRLRALVPSEERLREVIADNERLTNSREQLRMRWDETLNALEDARDRAEAAKNLYANAEKLLTEARADNERLTHELTTARAVAQGNKRHVAHVMAVCEKLTAELAALAPGWESPAALQAAYNQLLAAEEDKEERLDRIRDLVGGWIEKMRDDIVDLDLPQVQQLASWRSPVLVRPFRDRRNVGDDGMPTEAAVFIVDFREGLTENQWEVRDIRGVPDQAEMRRGTSVVNSAVASHGLADAKAFGSNVDEEPKRWRCQICLSRDDDAPKAIACLHAVQGEFDDDEGEPWIIPEVDRHGPGRIVCPEVDCPEFEICEECCDNLPCDPAYVEVAVAEHAARRAAVSNVDGEVTS